MDFNSIFEGLKKCVAPMFSGFETVMQIFFTTPPIMGLPLGAWLLMFSVVGLIMGAIFNG